MAAALRWALAGLLLALFAAALTAISNVQVTSAVLPGVQNPGFENGILDGAPQAWTVGSQADVVVVVDSEGPAEFATYADMGNITVSPYRGNLMLRLGTPKTVSQNQNRGNNTVAQTFQSDGVPLRFSFRLFSWEHRDRDIFRFDLKKGGRSVGDLAAPLVVTMPDGSPRQCAGLPCQLAINAGTRGQFLDTGWVPVKIVNVPAGTLTLSYTAGGSNDSAHATWAYFDNVNTPPVAKFTLSPAAPTEGQVISFQDLSYDPDPDDSIVSWQWNINGNPFSNQNPTSIFPDEGTYPASLTVTDTFGDSTTVSGGGTARDGDAVPPLAVQNFAPLMDALNVEALAGQQRSLLGRFADPGWTDRHSASWSLSNGSRPAATLQETNNPVVSNGLITGSTSVSSSLTGTLTVSDEDGGSRSDPFSITALADNPAQRQRHEPNDTVSGSIPVLNPGNVYLSFLQRSGDVDLFEVKLSDGALLPAGAQLLVNLFDLPSDYDLAILRQPPAGATSGISGEPSLTGLSQVDSATSSFNTLALNHIGWGQIGWGQIGWGQIGWGQIGWGQIGWGQIGWGQIGWGQIGWGQIGTEVASTDIGLSELGLGSIGGSGIQVADFSAYRGVDSESALATSSAAGTRFIIAVSGSNGAHSGQPYSLSVEVMQPPDLEAQLGAACQGSPLVSDGVTTSPRLLHDYDDPATPGNDPAQTLFVTQEQRVRALYSLDDAAWGAFLADMVALAQHDAVRGDILSLPSSIYDTWDTHPCSVDAANSVAVQTRDIIGARFSGSLQNVVIVGGDDVVPFRRVADQTVIGNERNFIQDSLQKPGSPLFASVIQGYILSDDYFVDQAPGPGELYLPDRAIGRLVETPDEIRGAAQSFLASNGLLNASSGFVSGYDFFKDGAGAIADAIDSGTGTAAERLIDDSWTADDLRCHLLGQGGGACQVHDINAPNAHFTPHAALSARGFADEDFSDFVSSSEVASAGGGTPALQNVIVFSMGCHAGFSSSDRGSAEADAGLGIDPALDFAQAMARQRAVFVASTGYGLGDDVGIGGTERLMGDFARELLQGSVTAGQALAQAKQKFIGSLSAVTVYDVKSSIQATLYGMPNYQIASASGLSVAPATMQGVPLSSTEEALQLTTVDPAADVQTVTTSHTLAEVVVPEGTGSYFTADGDAQGTPGRSVQPRVVSSLTDRHPHTGDPPPVQDVLLTGGAYRDIAAFDPVIVRPTLEWEEGVREPQECLAGFWPSRQGVLNGQNLITIPGQFRCTSGAAANVTGVERLYTALTFELQRCAASDGAPPLITGIDLREGEGSDVLVTVGASDPSGISRIVVLRIGGGAVTPFQLSLAQPYPQSGRFVITVPGVGPEDELIAQVQDGGCLVASATGKGAQLNLIRANAGPDQLFVPGTPNTFSTAISAFTSLTTPVVFVWDFGDGGFRQGILAPEELRNVPVTIDAFGNATFTVQHSYALDTPLPVTATLRVTDAAGGIGVDDVVVRCDALGDAVSPDADFVGCAASNTGATMTIGVRVHGEISDGFQYRVGLDVGKYNSKAKAYRQPPDGGMDVQLKYDRGNATGLTSLQVVRIGNELRFTFALSELGLKAGDRVQWFAETQAGVPSEPTTGKVDTMPDGGFFSYTLK